MFHVMFITTKDGLVQYDLFDKHELAKFLYTCANLSSIVVADVEWIEPYVTEIS